MTDGGIATRRACEADLGAVLELLQAAMHRADDPRFVDLFRWKHLDNAFGASPAWVAVDGDRIAAVRYLMRWEFERGGQVVRAVRAVDTATHPDYQGKGLFRRLTLGAIDELRSQEPLGARAERAGVEEPLGARAERAGVEEPTTTAFVFNTPNDQSRPGYLKMGWQVVGKPAVPTRPLSVRGLVAMRNARVPAEHFSLPCTVGVPVADVLGDQPAVEQLLAARAVDPRLRTRLDCSVLRWRYGGELLEYRAIVASAGIDQGVAIFRIRRRGPAREAALVLLVAPPGRRTGVVKEFRRAVRHVADYAVALGDRPALSWVSLPGAGPMLTWRAVDATAMPAASEWSLTLGDIELF